MRSGSGKQNSMKRTAKYEHSCGKHGNACHGAAAKSKNATKTKEKGRRKRTAKLSPDFESKGQRI